MYNQIDQLIGVHLVRVQDCGGNKATHVRSTLPIPENVKFRYFYNIFRYGYVQIRLQH